MISYVDEHIQRNRHVFLFSLTSHFLKKNC